MVRPDIGVSCRGWNVQLNDTCILQNDIDDIETAGSQDLNKYRFSRGVGNGQKAENRFRQMLKIAELSIAFIGWNIQLQLTIELFEVTIGLVALNGKRLEALRKADGLGNTLTDVDSGTTEEVEHGAITFSGHGTVEMCGNPILSQWKEYGRGV